MGVDFIAPLQIWKAMFCIRCAASLTYLGAHRYASKPYSIIDRIRTLHNVKRQDCDAPQVFPQSNRDRLSRLPHLSVTYFKRRPYVSYESTIIPRCLCSFLTCSGCPRNDKHTWGTFLLLVNTTADNFEREIPIQGTIVIVGLAIYVDDGRWMKNIDRIPRRMHRQQIDQRWRICLRESHLSLQRIVVDRVHYFEVCSFQKLISFCNAWH